jgi:DNA uptake protein ComE-like DNA-binding protein
MASLLPDSRSIAPLILAGALTVIGIAPFQGRSAAQVERVRVDPGRDSPLLIQSLEGMGAETARRIIQARRYGVPFRSPAGLLAIPGVGTRHLHRWHDDLAFPDEQP